MRVSTIIPAYNEEGRIGRTVRSVLPFSDEVIVVDDGSRDATFREAKEAGAKTVKLPRNLGKGTAVKIGFGESRGDIILLLDADLEDTAGEARKLLEPVLRGEADMTIGVLPMKKGGFGIVQGLAYWGLRMLTLGKFPLKLPLSGQRAVKREVLEGFRWERGFGLEISLTVQALRRGFRVREIVVNMKHRRTGRDIRGFLHRGKQCIHIAIAILKLLFMR